MFVISNGKIRLTDAAYANWMVIVTLVFPCAVSVFFGLSLRWDIPSLSFVMGVFSILTFFMGIVLSVSEQRRRNDTAAYDGLVSVISATEDRSKQVIIRLYKGPEALDKATSVSFKVDHGVIPIVEFDDDEEIIDLEDDDEEDFANNTTPIMRPTERMTR